MPGPNSDYLSHPRTGVIDAVERDQRDQRAASREAHGDAESDPAVHLGRRRCGLKLRERAKALERKNDPVVATDALHDRKRTKEHRAKHGNLQKVLQWLNCTMCLWESFRLSP